MSNSLPISELTATPAISLDRLGDRVKGRVTSADRAHSRDPKTGELLYWNDGRKREETHVRMTVDGEERLLYCRGGKYEVVEGEGTSLEVAVVEAVVAAGATAIEPGATLEVVYSGNGRASRAGFTPPKLYRARYTPPAPSALPLGALFADTAAAPPAAPAPAPAPAPAASSLFST